MWLKESIFYVPQKGYNYLCFIGTMHLGSLSVSNIVKTLRPWSERWINVAELLGVPTAVISKIRVITTRQKSQDTALYKVVEWWFKNSPNPEWSAISEVIAAVKVPQTIPPGKVDSSVASVSLS